MIWGVASLTYLPMGGLKLSNLLYERKTIAVLLRPLDSIQGQVPFMVMSLCSERRVRTHQNLSARLDNHGRLGYRNEPESGFPLPA